MKKRMSLRNLIIMGTELSLVFLMVISAITLLFVSARVGKVFLVIGIVCAGSALAFFILRKNYLRPLKNNVDSKESNNKEVIKPVLPVVEHPKDVSSEAQHHTIEPEIRTIIQEPEDYSRLQALGKMMELLEENYVKPLEKKVANSSNPSADANAICERLFDIAFLSMDLANVFTRPDCSYDRATEQLLFEEIDKATLLSLLDNTIRPTKEYQNLRRVLDSILPGTSYFYSGYKL